MTKSSAGNVVIVDFPGVTGIKRRPAVVLSSNTYHATRPDVIIGLITSQTTDATAPTDFLLQDWAAVGPRLPSAFRSFLVTPPRSAMVTRISQLSDADWQAVQLRVNRALA
jgi:mRNA interferase MazF